MFISQLMQFKFTFNLLIENEDFYEFNSVISSKLYWVFKLAIFCSTQANSILQLKCIVNCINSKGLLLINMKLKTSRIEKNG